MTISDPVIHSTRRYTERSLNTFHTQVSFDILWMLSILFGFTDLMYIKVSCNSTGWNVPEKKILFSKRLKNLSCCYLNWQVFLWNTPTDVLILRSRRVNTRFCAAFLPCTQSNISNISWHFSTSNIDRFILDVYIVNYYIIILRIALDDSKDEPL